MRLIMRRTQSFETAYHLYGQQQYSYNVNIEFVAVTTTYKYTRTWTRYLYQSTYYIREWKKISFHVFFVTFTTVNGSTQKIMAKKSNDTFSQSCVIECTGQVFLILCYMHAARLLAKFRAPFSIQYCQDSIKTSYTLLSTSDQ